VILRSEMLYSVTDDMSHLWGTLELLKPLLPAFSFILAQMPVNQRVESAKNCLLVLKEMEANASCRAAFKIMDSRTIRGFREGLDVRKIASIVQTTYQFIAFSSTYRTGSIAPRRFPKSTTTAGNMAVILDLLKKVAMI